MYDFTRSGVDVFDVLTDMTLILGSSWGFCYNRVQSPHFMSCFTINKAEKRR